MIKQESQEERNKKIIMIFSKIAVIIAIVIVIYVMYKEKIEYFFNYLIVLFYAIVCSIIIYKL